MPIFGHLGNTIRINAYVIFFSTWHKNMASVEYIEAIFDIVSVTIATLGQHKPCLFFHKIVYILKINSVTCRFSGPCNTLPSHFSSPHRSKSIPVSSNGVPSLVLNSGNGAVVGARYGLVEKTLQVLHRLMAFLTLDHKCGARYCSFIATIVFATPRCIKPVFH